MVRSIRLRPWQKRALDALTRHPHPDFLAVATPGAGKTTLALTAARRHLADDPRASVVVVTPTQHLKAQWATAGAAFALQLDPAWSVRQGRLPSDLHGIVVTYQQVATAAAPLRSLCKGAFVVFDEIHHAGDDRAWGEAVRLAFEPAARRLALSGTPFRSDTSAIPFITYRDQQARPDFTYGYADALAEGGVVRPVSFPRVNGHMEWSAPDGSLHASTFDDRLDRVRAGQRLRTALSLDGEWLPTVLSRADAHLRHLRRTVADAGGLVIATDQDHARGIAGMMQARLGVEPVVATSDDPMASTRIARFASGTAPWIVAVRMVSEGVDVPRLRVGVYATNTTTELFFRQAVGRLVRWRAGGGSEPAAMFIPDDERLRRYAGTLIEQRNHSLRRRTVEDAAVGREGGLPGADEQLSLFSAISAVATDTELGGFGGFDLVEDDVDGGVVVDLPPPPVRAQPEGAPPALPRHEHVRALRTHNAERAKLIVQLSGWGHARVNSELNRMAGVRRISEATVGQLQRRLDHADRWLTRL